MARGRKKVLEESELPIKVTKNEDGCIPFFLIEENYGIAVDSYCYKLCKRIVANRTIKDDDGKPSYIEQYFKWDSFKYCSSFESIMETYIECKDRELKSKDYKDIIKNQEEIKKILHKALDSKISLSKDFISANAIVEQYTRVQAKLNEIEQYADEKLTKVESKRGRKKKDED